jgi:hypothetical protein
VYVVGSGRLLTAEDDIELVRASFLHSPKKSTGTAAKELSMSKTTVWRVLRKCLVFKPYHHENIMKRPVFPVKVMKCVYRPRSTSVEYGASPSTMFSFTVRVFCRVAVCTAEYSKF